MRVVSLPNSEFYYEARGRGGKSGNSKDSSPISSSNKTSSNKTSSNKTASNSGSLMKPCLMQSSTDSNAFLLSGQTFFGVSFNPFDHENNVFACVGGRKVG